MRPFCKETAMNFKTCAFDGRLVAAALVGFALLATPLAARADDTTPTTPPASTDQSDQNQPGYNNGVPAQSTPPPAEAPPAENPPAEHHHKFVIGINGGLYFPTSGKAQNRLGNTWWSAGIGIGAIPRVTGHGNWDVDLRTQYQTGATSAHVFVCNLGLEYRRRFDTSKDGGNKEYKPFYGVSADAVFIDLKSPLDNVSSGLNVVPGASVFVGTNIGRQELITLRYDAMSDVKGFN